MTARPAFFHFSARIKLPKTLSGDGQILAAGLNPARVRYVLNLEEQCGEVACHGTLRGTHAALVPMWLTPSVVLRLQDAQRVLISITALEGKLAVFVAVEYGPERRAHRHRYPSGGRGR